MESLPSPPPEPPAGTTARAVALRFEPDSLVLAGTGLDLTVESSASASQRQARGDDAVLASASALGLAFGESRFLADPADDAFFTSRGLTVVSGGGRINGEANANATASGGANTSADAEAINIAIAQTDLLSRNADPLWIGSALRPFRAQATAAAGSADSTLTATARVRGLEGTPAADLSPVPTFSGQPHAVVEALARLNPAPGTELGAASGALADATALEGYRVLALSSWDGQRWGAQVGGRATARLDLPTPAAPSSDPGVPVQLAVAIGIDNTTILGPAKGGLKVVGEGYSSLEGGSAAAADLVGLGIHASTVIANGGDSEVLGLGGVGQPTLAAAARNAAGIDASTVLVGGGNDRVVGRSLVAGSFDGIRASTVNTGAGNDAIGGTASGSILSGGRGQDLIGLERSRDSLLDGGFGNDRIQVGAGSLDNQLFGGFGNDQLQAIGGRGNRLDGGFGQDQLSGNGGGGEIFVQSNAGAALRAADSRDFAEQLADPAFWASLPQAAREEIWSTGRWLQGGQLVGAVDVINGLDPSRGDTLEISSSLAGITQELWQSGGALYNLVQGQLVGQGEGAGASAGPGLAGAVGVVVGSLAEIRSLGVGSPSIAYASDTHQLLFDADGDWSRGAIGIGSVTLAPGTSLRKGDIRFDA